MNTTPALSDALRKAFEPPASGFVGIVDQLLALCQGGELELNWHSDGCRVRFCQGGIQEFLTIPLRKSVFRAILARIAVLCNNYQADSVSPYGGQGKLCLGSNPLEVVFVRFVNTPEEQKLELLHSNRNKLADGNHHAAPPSASLTGSGTAPPP